MLWLNQKMTHQLWRGVLLLLQAIRFTKDKTGGKKSHRLALKEGAKPYRIYRREDQRLERRLF